MTIPAWILGIFAAAMLAVAAVSAARLAARRAWQRRRGAAVADIDVAHLLMGIAMAGALTSSLHTLPDGAWAVIFGALTAWFGAQVARNARQEGFRALSGARCAPHLIHSAAMLYMFAAVAAPAAAVAAGGSGAAGMGGMGGSGMQTLDLPVLAFVFALLLIGYCVWDLDQLSGPGVTGHYSVAAPRVWPARPALAGVPVAASATTSLAGAAASPVLAGWVTTSCRIAMGVTMAFMLVIMI
jgi:hypothetical protein